MTDPGQPAATDPVSLDPLSVIATSLGEISATLRRIEQRLPPALAKPTPRRRREPRRFTRGMTVPLDVDLLIANGGLRWSRLFDPEQVEYGTRGAPLDQWCPRDVGTPVLSTSALLDLVGAAIEVIDPGEESRPILADVPDQVMPPLRPTTWPDDPRRLRMPDGLVRPADVPHTGAEEVPGADHGS